MARERGKREEEEDEVSFELDGKEGRRRGKVVPFGRREGRG